MNMEITKEEYTEYITYSNDGYSFLWLYPSKKSTKKMKYQFMKDKKVFAEMLVKKHLTPRNIMDVYKERVDYLNKINELLPTNEGNK